MPSVRNKGVGKLPKVRAHVKRIRSKLRELMQSKPPWPDPADVPRWVDQFGEVVFVEETVKLGPREARALAGRRLPEDYSVGLRVYFKRGGKTLTGYVSKVTYDPSHPAYVRCNGRTFKPRVDEYCSRWGEPLHRLVIPHYTGTRSQAAKPRGAKALRDLMRATCDELRDAPIGASHVPLPLPAGVYAAGSIGRDEYARGIGEYVVRADEKGVWGIWTREFNVRLATFVPNSYALRSALQQLFDAAHAGNRDARRWS